TKSFPYAATVAIANTVRDQNFAIDWEMGYSDGTQCVRASTFGAPPAGVTCAATAPGASCTTYAYAIVHNYFTPSFPSGNPAVLAQRIVAGVPGPYTTVAGLSSLSGPGAGPAVGAFDLGGTPSLSTTS
ncbi:MAG TPA: hypothetical protein VHW47_00675, partial [Acidimicrobiales bacterium]|nr:hypothetical protein [Acidimicrobiales bacterium]